MKITMYLCILCYWLDYSCIDSHSGQRPFVCNLLLYTRGWNVDDDPYASYIASLYSQKAMKELGTIARTTSIPVQFLMPQGSQVMLFHVESRVTLGLVSYGTSDGVCEIVWGTFSSYRQQMIKLKLQHGLFFPSLLRSGAQTRDLLLPAITLIASGLAVLLALIHVVLVLARRWRFDAFPIDKVKPEKAIIFLPQVDVAVGAHLLEMLEAEDRVVDLGRLGGVGHGNYCTEAGEGRSERM